MKVFIKHGNEEKLEIEIDSTDTIATIKQKIKEKANVEPQNQRIIFSGKILKDEDTVQSVKLAEGNTMHLVKLSKPAASASTTTAAPPTVTGPTSVPQSPSAAAPASPGMAQLPNMASLFGGNPGAMPGLNDPGFASMLNNPALLQMSMQMLASNPQMLQTILNSNPQFASLSPEMRQMMSSPEMIRLLSDPNIIQQAMGMNAGMNSFGMGAPPAANPTTPQSPAVGQIPGALGGSGFNPALFQQMMTGMMPPAPPVSNEPPEVRYEVQLRQLNDMGFFDPVNNIRALQATGGNVNSAVEYLLSRNLQ
ncbi:Ubiquilin domain-containing protein [Rozella allomycis CSF55]|uniref:Ubiquilin domain-containing protein n=1 Tax=Rozella allomycis (strain CSF55) TaxID=988480 RepID=A0A075ASS1_ROZAC|nr:Ubiquilin domain-containing protein [Rozella allomycis CSF55]|eukprot:EPZ33205.1 Ubiquilin domain-containing protein [Rozella allomycis CSF55]